MKHKVHLFCTVRVPVDVEGAQSQEDAIDKAIGRVVDDLDRRFNGYWAEEIPYALVDDLDDNGELLGDSGSFYYRPDENHKPVLVPSMQDWPIYTF